MQIFVVLISGFLILWALEIRFRMYLSRLEELEKKAESTKAELFDLTNRLRTLKFI